MLYDFLYACECALTDEAADFKNVLRSFANKSVCVGFMPAIADDLYPVFALSCAGARKIVDPDIYMIPIGAHDDWAKPYFEEIINKFYEADEYEEQFDIELEEMILLNNPDLDHSFSLSGGTDYNVIFCRVILPDGTDKYLIIVPESPDACWKKVMEPYGIKCDIIIDSHKGMGDWFDTVPLYRIMRETHLTELLPRYYFRGLYISHDTPCGFQLRYTIPDNITYRGRNIDDWQKEIYEIDWDENRKCES